MTAFVTHVCAKRERKRSGVIMREAQLHTYAHMHTYHNIITVLHV